jgi:hypothetical protein
MKFIIIFISLCKLTYNIYVLQPETFFKYIEEEKVNKEKLDDIIKKLSEGMEEVYAFYTLSKNPPKTEYKNIIHNKVDIKEELKKIETTNRNYYNFYQDFLRVFAKIKDGHTTIFFLGLDKFTESFYKAGATIYFPIIFNIKNDTNGIPRLYCKPNKNEALNNLFRNNKDIFPIIKKNNEIPIKAIKGKNPFDFIGEFISQFLDLRNPHGSFTQSFNILNGINLAIIPIYKENTTNFKIEYDNNDSFETDLLILLKDNIFKSHSLTPIASIQSYFFDPINFDKMINEFIFIPEIKDLPYDLIKLDKFGKFKIELDSNLNSIKGSSMTKKDWKHSTSDESLKCRVDNENKFNVYLVKSFSPNIFDEFVEVIEQCSELFDQNNYKTIVIQSFNGGGYVVLSEFLLEMVSPYTSINIYSRIRATPAIKSNFRYVFNTIDKCEDQSQIDFFDSFDSVNYNEAKEDLTKPFLMVEKRLREKSRKLRKNMKNKRKPTDIMVFTDGFSFSATSMFLKYLQHYGGGIVVGYFGNPSKNENIPFDSSLSPSGIISIDALSLWNKNFEALKTNYSTFLQFALIQSFFDKDNKSVPLEYEVTPVDERISLYENFNESNYHVFVQKAKEIFANYENKCNPKNKNLFLLDNKCDHGGYPCGGDGTWDKTKCVQFYCEIGFIYDKGSHKCIPDNCSYSNIFYYIILLLIILSDLTIFVMIIYCFYVCCCRKKKIVPVEPLLS